MEEHLLLFVAWLSLRIAGVRAGRKPANHFHPRDDPAARAADRQRLNTNFSLFFFFLKIFFFFFFFLGLIFFCFCFCF